MHFMDYTVDIRDPLTAHSLHSSVLQCGVTGVKCGSTETVVCAESHRVHPVGVALEIATQHPLDQERGKGVFAVFKLHSGEYEIRTR